MHLIPYGMQAPAPFPPKKAAKAGEYLIFLEPVPFLSISEKPYFESEHQ